jgi:hypothetical protein
VALDQPVEVLYQRADEALGAAVSLGRPDEGWPRCGSEPGDLSLEVAGHVLAAVVVADARALGCRLLDAAEALGDALPDRLQRLVACAVEGGEDADVFRRAMVDGDEHRHWPCSTVNAEVMSVPHIVSMVSGVIVPSWLRGRPGRVAAARPFSRIRRRTRSFEVRRP